MNYAPTTYIFSEVNPKSGIMRDIHYRALNRKCQIVNLVPQERGTIRYWPDDDSDGWPHNLYTSPVVSVASSVDEDSGLSTVVIETKNTFYVLKECDD